MAIIHLSGGGDALQNAMSSATEKKNLYIVDDGVYNPISLLSTFVVTNGVNSTIEISAARDSNVVIDGGVKWVNDDIFSEEIEISGNDGLHDYSTAKYTLSIYNLNFRNCINAINIVNSNNSGNNYLINCKVKNALRIISNNKLKILYDCYFENIVSAAVRSIICNTSNMTRCSGRNIVCYSLCDSTTMRNCVFDNISAYTLNMYNSITYSSLFTNVTITNTNWPSIFTAPRYPIINNTIEVISCYAKRIPSFHNTWNTNTLSNMIVANNIVIGNVQLAATNVSATYLNNYLRTYSGNMQNSISGNIDPCFKDKDNLDYHLAKDSPFISAGTTEYLSKVPLDLDFRPFDSNHPSIGCYQFQENKYCIPNKQFPSGTI